MANKIILENPNGRRFQLVVDNDGNLGTKEVPAPCKPEYEVKYLVNPDLVLNDDGTYTIEECLPYRGLDSTIAPIHIIHGSQDTYIVVPFKSPYKFLFFDALSIASNSACEYILVSIKVLSSLLPIISPSLTTIAPYGYLAFLLISIAISINCSSFILSRII